MLDAKLQNLKQQGEQSVKHKPCIENENLRRLKESAVMSPSTPQGLLNNVWFLITLNFCRRGGQRNLKKSSFVFLQDENGKRYATMAHDKASKNDQGGLSDNTISFEKLSRMYQTAHANDRYNALRLSSEKLNPECRLSFNTQSILGRDHKKECGLRIDALGWTSSEIWWKLSAKRPTCQRLTTVLRQQRLHRGQILACLIVL